MGVAAAAAMIALRTDDGSAPPEFYVPASTDVGEWQPTPSCPPAGGILLQWRNLRPFAIETTDQFRAAPPPAIASRRYARDYAEVKRVGDVDSPFRPQDRADVARSTRRRRRYRCGTRQRHRSPLSRAARCPRARGRSRWSTWRSAMRRRRYSRRSITTTSGAPRLRFAPAMPTAIRSLAATRTSSRS